jgi:hypothetical protein
MAGGNRRRRVDSLCNWGIGGGGDGDIDDGSSGGGEGGTGIRSSREGTGGVWTSCLYTGRDPKARESGVGIVGSSCPAAERKSRGSDMMQSEIGPVR